MIELVEDIIFIAAILFVIILVLLTLNWYFNQPRYDSEDEEEESSKMFNVEPNNKPITEAPTPLSSASAAAATSSTDGDNVVTIFPSKNKRSELIYQCD